MKRTPATGASASSGSRGWGTRPRPPPMCDDSAGRWNGRALSVSRPARRGREDDCRRGLVRVPRGTAKAAAVGLPEGSALYKKFTENPTSPGLNYEKVQGARDPKVRSARIDDRYR